MSFVPEPLRIPSFRALWLARLATTVAQMAMVIVIGWQVYDIARETMGLKEAAFRLGIIGLVQFVPMIALTLVVGQVADRYDRRLVVVVCDIAQAGAVGVLALGTAGGWLTRSRPRSSSRAVPSSATLPLSLAALGLLGASDLLSVVVRQSPVQIRTPDGMRGRVSAVRSLFTGTSNQLGEFESGRLAALFGAVPAALVGGLGTIAVALPWMYRFPELGRFQMVG